MNLWLDVILTYSSCKYLCYGEIMEMTMRRKLIALSLLSAFAISACGVKGDLKTPPPLWGDGSKVEQSESSDPNTSE